MRFKPLLPAAILLLCAMSAQAQNAHAARDASGAQNGQAPVYPAESETPEHVKGLPSDAKLLRDHLAEGESAPAGGRIAGGKAPSAPAVPGGPGNVPRGKDDGLGVASAVKDFVKPIQQEISNSGVVQAVREFDTTISGRSFTKAGDTPVGYGPATTGRAPARKPDAMAANLMWEQFLDEVLPWLAGGAFLLLLGYGAFLWLKILRMKKLRVGQRRRAHRRSRRSSRRTTI